MFHLQHLRKQFSSPIRKRTISRYNDPITPRRIIIIKSILEELFYGNVCPNTDCRSKDKETKELMGYVADHHDTLLKELTDKQKETLEKFDDCYNELTDINEREIFVYAFRLGARIAIEVLFPNAES